MSQTFMRERVKIGQKCAASAGGSSWKTQPSAANLEIFVGLVQETEGGFFRTSVPGVGVNKGRELVGLGQGFALPAPTL